MSWLHPFLRRKQLKGGGIKTAPFGSLMYLSELDARPLHRRRNRAQCEDLGQVLPVLGGCVDVFVHVDPVGGLAGGAADRVGVRLTTHESSLGV